MSRPLRVICYAINGTGLGHLTRLLAVARELRVMASAVGQRVDVQFITTSEASHIANDFPVYKLPSKTVVSATEGNFDRFRRSAKMIISNLIATMEPDLLLLDTQPEGSYREFVFIKDYARARVFIDRHKDRRHSQSASHLSHLALYDRVLVPDHPDRAEHYPVPAKLKSRQRFVGPITGLRKPLLEAQEVRAEFGIAETKRIVYLSAGGGGDNNAERDLKLLLDSLLEHEEVHVIVGYGPLYQNSGNRRRLPYRGGEGQRNRVTVITGEARCYFGALDCAISAAGYNTYQELLEAAVPTLFYAQSKGMDRQDLRIEQGAARDWHLALQTFDPASLQQQIAQLFDPHQQEKLRHGLRQRPASTGATEAALECLDVIAADRDIDRGRLHAAASMRSQGEPLDPSTSGAFAQNAHTGLAWLEITSGASAVQDFGAQAQAARIAGQPITAAWQQQAQDLIEVGSWLSHVREHLAWREHELQRFLRSYLTATTGNAEQGERSLRTLVDDLMERLTATQLAALFTAAQDCVRSSDLAAFLDAIAAALADGADTAADSALQSSIDRLTTLQLDQSWRNRSGDAVLHAIQMTAAEPRRRSVSSAELPQENNDAYPHQG